MPAVRAFSLYAALSLALNFVLQMTAFIGLTSLDFHRQTKVKHDVFCCFKSKTEEEFSNEDGFLQVKHHCTLTLIIFSKIHYTSSNPLLKINK